MHDYEECHDTNVLSGPVPQMLLQESSSFHFMHAFTRVMVVFLLPFGVLSFLINSCISL